MCVCVLCCAAVLRVHERRALTELNAGGRRVRARERLEFCRRGRSELVMETEGTGINNILARGGGALWRTSVLAKHFATQEEARGASSTTTSSGSLRRSACLEYASPECNSGQISVFFLFFFFSLL